LIDAGTYAYHEDPAWRDHFRSTPAHNTLTLDNKNQSEIQGAFLWGRKARSRFVAHDLREGWVEGETEAYLPDTITRRVQLAGDALTVRDRVGRDATGSVQWYWHFHPDWQVALVGEGVWRITDGVRVCTLQLSQLIRATPRGSIAATRRPSSAGTRPASGTKCPARRWWWRRNPCPTPSTRQA
jgi:hypothetical protein